jgi:hypothetical protein
VRLGIAVFGSSLISLVPLISHLFLPVGLLLDLGHTLFDQSQRLSHFEVLHVLLVVQLVGKLQQFVYLSLLFLLGLLFGRSPCRLSGFLSLVGL